MLIVVLGGGVSLTGELPPHVFQRLDTALKLHAQHPHSPIVLSGKYSSLYADQKPLVTEAHQMAAYLLTKGIPQSQLLLEEESMDTIGNAYYLKKNIFLPRAETHAIIVTSRFHIERVKYIFEKVFGSEYSFEFVSILEHFPAEEEIKIKAHQAELILKTQAFLDTMKSGDHEFLTDKLYTAPFYQGTRPAWVTQFVSKGK